jgi:tRNA pseudouridine13 synthase
LEKTGWTTPDAVGWVCRCWQLDRGRVSFGGLKDRHAVTSQFLTIEGGPSQNLEGDRIVLVYLGRSAEPYSSSHIRANRFTITIRDVSHEDAARGGAAAADVSSTGLPNYFDDQRFGSLGGSGEFVGRLLVRGEFETAMKLALTTSYEYDRADAKRAKATLRKRWGNWSACRAALPRALAEYLTRHPTDFRGAIVRLHPELQGMHLATYQSDLWNRTLARWLKSHFSPADLGGIETKRGPLPAPLRADKAWRNLTIPLPSARMQPVPGAAWWPALTAILDEEALSLNRLRVPGVRKPFFSKGERAACVIPAGLSVETADDDMHSGRKKLVLQFDLPRGSYATMVVRRLSVTSWPPVS